MGDLISFGISMLLSLSGIGIVIFMISLGIYYANKGAKMNMELTSEKKDVEFIKMYLLSEKKRASQIMSLEWSSHSAKLDVIINVSNRLGVFGKMLEMFSGIIDHEDYCELINLLESISNILKDDDDVL